MRLVSVAVFLILVQAGRAQNDCLPCHKAEVDRFARTGMGRSISAPHQGEAQFDHKPSHTRFSVTDRKGQIVHLAERAGLAAEYPIAFAIGSGNVGQSYAVQISGAWFESPVSWYAQHQRWDVSPGYERESAPD